jgi:mono/diheme cytochrome c family protein
MQRRRLVLLVSLFAVTTTILVAAWADEPPKGGAEQWKAPARAARKKNPVPADEKSIAAGKVFYVKECLACHGATGKGDGPSAKDLERPAGDLSNPKMWQQTDGELFWKITEGKKPMPSYEKNFSEEDRWNVVNYTRTLAPKPTTAP